MWTELTFSVFSLTTKLYDNFQYFTNGILWGPQFWWRKQNLCIFNIIYWVLRIYYFVCSSNKYRFNELVHFTHEIMLLDHGRTQPFIKKGPGPVVRKLRRKWKQRWYFPEIVAALHCAGTIYFAALLKYLPVSNLKTANFRNSCDI